MSSVCNWIIKWIFHSFLLTGNRKQKLHKERMKTTVHCTFVFILLEFGENAHSECRQREEWVLQLVGTILLKNLCVSRAQVPECESTECISISHFIPYSTIISFSFFKKWFVIDISSNMLFKNCWQCPTCVKHSENSSHWYHSYLVKSPLCLTRAFYRIIYFSFVCGLMNLSRAILFP